jgi:HSP20 family protein
MAQFSFIPSGETSELAEDIRELFEDLAAHLKQEQRAYSGECHPSLDVLENRPLGRDRHGRVRRTVGCPSRALPVERRHHCGEKAPKPAGSQQTFHLVEREFGRFARAVRLNGAFDVARAEARLRDGELTVVLPKVTDRRTRRTASPSPIRRLAPDHGHDRTDNDPR